MRFVALGLAMTIACKQNPDPDVAPASADRPALAMDHVTLLEPEAVLEQRVTGPDGIVTAIKAATDAVIAFDRAHAGALPAEVDVVIAARATGMRCWLVGEPGDIAIGELDARLAVVPKIPVRDGDVAVVAVLVRAGTKPAPSGPYLPAAWRAAAGKQGAAIDDVIDAAWPR